MHKQKNELQRALNQAHQRDKQPRQWPTTPGSKLWLVAGMLCLSSVTVQAKNLVEQLGIKILAELPHDPAAFTQGLLLYKGHFYESTGLYGHSSLRKVQPISGEIVAKRKLESGYFGEGLARVGQQLIQLTWREGQALVYDLADLSLQQVFHYQGEGWGLCFDGEQLWMSDGSSVLQQRNPQDFSLQHQLSVTLNGKPLNLLNELACVGEHVYANIWQDHRLVRINKTTGLVEAEIDASAVIAASGRGRNPEAVLNGIAYDEQEKVFYLTGKLWPKMFKVQWQASAEHQAPGT